MSKSERLLEDILEVKSEKITKPFWWDCNSCHGAVVSEGDWLYMIWQSVISHQRPGYRERTTLDDLAVLAAET